MKKICGESHRLSEAQGNGVGCQFHGAALRLHRAVIPIAPPALLTIGNDPNTGIEPRQGRVKNNNTVQAECCAVKAVQAKHSAVKHDHHLPPPANLGEVS